MGFSGQTLSPDVHMPHSHLLQLFGSNDTFSMMPALVALQKNSTPSITLHLSYLVLFSVQHLTHLLTLCAIYLVTIFKNLSPSCRVSSMRALIFVVCSLFDSAYITVSSTQQMLNKSCLRSFLPFIPCSSRSSLFQGALFHAPWDLCLYLFL